MTASAGLLHRDIRLFSTLALYSLSVQIEAKGYDRAHSIEFWPLHFSERRAAASRHAKALACRFQSDAYSGEVGHRFRWDVGLIVLPTHGYGLFRRYILGSVTAQVLHDVKCPVWTGVHMQDPLMEPVANDTIVCGIDLENDIKPLSWSWTIEQELGRT